MHFAHPGISHILMMFGQKNFANALYHLMPVLAMPILNQTLAFNYINEKRTAAQERPVTVGCVADAGSHPMREPRLVVQDVGAPSGIDCGNVHAFEEAVWESLRVSKATHRDRLQAMDKDAGDLHLHTYPLPRKQQPAYASMTRGVRAVVRAGEPIVTFSARVDLHTPRKPISAKGMGKSRQRVGAYRLPSPLRVR